MTERADATHHEGPAGKRHREAGVGRRRQPHTCEHHGCGKAQPAPLATTSSSRSPPARHPRTQRGPGPLGAGRAAAPPRPPAPQRTRTTPAYDTHAHVALRHVYLYTAHVCLNPAHMQARAHMRTLCGTGSTLPLALCAERPAWLYAHTPTACRCAALGLRSRPGEAVAAPCGVGRQSRSGSEKTKTNTEARIRFMPSRNTAALEPKSTQRRSSTQADIQPGTPTAPGTHQIHAVAQ